MKRTSARPATGIRPGILVTRINLKVGQRYSIRIDKRDFDHRINFIVRPSRNNPRPAKTLRAFELYKLIHHRVCEGGAVAGDRNVAIGGARRGCVRATESGGPGGELHLGYR